jgi:hypothetical protein
LRSRKEARGKYDMKVSRLVRLLAVPAMAAPLIAGSMLVAGPAFAKAKIPECAAKVNTTTLVVTFSKCKDTANTGKGGTMNATAIVSGGTATANWSNGSSTTIAWNPPVMLAAGAPGNTCPAGDIEYEGTGTVTGGTPPAITSIPVGDTVTMNVCLSSKGKVKVLKPGILFS